MSLPVSAAAASAAVGGGSFIFGRISETYEINYSTWPDALKQRLEERPRAVIFRAGVALKLILTRFNLDMNNEIATISGLARFRGMPSLAEVTAALQQAATPNQ